MNSSRMELGESIIFQPVLQAYPTQHSWIITAHISLGNLDCHWKTFNRQFDRTQQLLWSLDQYPISPNPVTVNTSIGTIQHQKYIQLWQNNHNFCHKTTTNPTNYGHTSVTEEAYYPVLGDALSWLTGTATTRDIHSIKTRINQLIAQHKHPNTIP